MRKTTTTDKIRHLIQTFPAMSVADIAKKLGVRYQTVWGVKKSMDVLKTKPVKGNHKLVKVLTSNTPLSQSITMQADEVTNLTEEQKSRLIENLGKPRMRMATREEKISAPAVYEVKQTALEVQVGGDHYKTMAIQPVVYCEKNKLSHLESNIVKRISRWRTKDGLKDLLKIKHEVDLLIELNGLNDGAEA